MLTNFISIQQLTFIGQVFLSIVLGGMLGLQRERWGKWAGPRTYALVCAGAALFTILSRNFFTNNSTVASAVISGIGFLGAGTILHKEDRVEGLTTAAGLWMVSAIGMTVGVEEYLLATIISLIILGVLMFNDKPLKMVK
ncbi:MAG: MgtC/SapB family protein [Candidatus Magasanikbacteria bacterium]|nr:MgtC/SapB family protein [Candidatus Magasanikbacteria bacterium]